MQRKGNSLIYYWWECKPVQSVWKTVRQFPRKLETELAYDPVTPLLDVYAKETKPVCLRDICTRMCIAGLFAVSKIQNQTRSPLTG